MKNYAAILTLLIILITIVFSACNDKDSKPIVSSDYNSVSSGVNDKTEPKDDKENNNTNIKYENDIDGGESSMNDSSVSSNNSDKITKPEDSISVPPSNVSSKVPADTSSDNDESSKDTGSVKQLTFKEYINLTAAEQQKYYKSFDSVEDFAEWYKKAQAEYKEDDGTIQIGGSGNFDLGEYVK